jgi:hypothetical protein
VRAVDVDLRLASDRLPLFRSHDNWRKAIQIEEPILFLSISELPKRLIPLNLRRPCEPHCRRLPYDEYAKL